MKTRRAFMHSLVAAALVPFMRRARARTELTPVQAFSVYNGFRFGWIRELPSLKKDTFVSPFALGEPLPTKVDLRSKMAPVYDQGDLGSCTSNAVAAMVQFVRKKSGEAPDFVPSRLFIYYNGRAIENSIEKDNGLQIRDGITVVENLGVCPEAEWPYDAEPANREGKFPANSRAVIKPPKVIFNEAYPHRAVDACAQGAVGDQRHQVAVGGVHSGRVGCGSAS